MPTRFVIYGAGAVGGTIGGRLHEHGNEVVLIARGDHGEICRKRGLLLRNADGEATLNVPTVAHPDELTVTEDDIVILAMKTQDTLAALESIATIAPPDTRIVCAQNGVENERLALRRFPEVQAMCVMLPATHLEPGVVEVSSTPVAGILDLGRYPLGADDTTIAVAGTLERAGFSSAPVAEVMRRKYAKLLSNLGNALDAACGDAGRASPLLRLAREEGRACFAAAGIDFASEEEDRARRGDLLQVKPVAGRPRGGGSTWQSIARGTGRTEVDYLNGEVVMLGRLHGVATPVNTLLQRTAHDLARSGAPAGSIPLKDLEARAGL